MKQFVLILAVVILITGCASPTPDPGAIETAIAQTQVAAPTSTEIAIQLTEMPAPTSTNAPTNTPEPTNTEMPAPTNTPAKSLEEVRNDFLGVVKDFLERGTGLEDIETVNLVRFGEPGVLEIEVKSIWASEDRQPQLSYEIIQFISTAFIGGGLGDEELRRLAGGPFRIHITTYSADNDYRYQSSTPFELMQRIESKSVSYEEWVQEAEAGFK